MKPEKEVMHFESAAEFEGWLGQNHESPTGIWLKLAKKNSTVPAPTYDEALEVALCFGWIDGQVKRFDDNLTLRSFTPRRKRSPWSKRNVGITVALIEQGRMRPSGMAEIERAKDDGRWERAYEGSAKAEPPPEFLKALEEVPEAKRAYEELGAQGRFLIYYRILDAKKQETKDRRIAKFVEQLSRGEQPG